MPCIFFSRVLRKKFALQTAVMLCMDDTLYEDDVLMIFDEMEVQNSRCREDNFSSKFLFPLRRLERVFLVAIVFVKR